MAKGRIKNRLKRPQPRNTQAMKHILAASMPKTRSLSVQNVRQAARRGLERLIPTVSAEGNDTAATASVLGLSRANVNAFKARNRII